MTARSGGWTDRKEGDTLDGMPRVLRRNELFEAATRCTLFSLRKASRGVTQIYDAALSLAGLRGTQFTVLVAAAFLEETTMARLAETLVMDRTTLTRNLAPLERAGLLRIGVGADRRSRIVKLSPSGRRRLALAYPLWKRAQAEIVRTLGRPRWNGLLDHLADVVAAHEARSQKTGRPGRRARGWDR
jgi:DNA-binding MarR family transcriptional regulator